MNSLITDQTQLIEAVGKAFDTSIDFNKAKPFFEVAYGKYLAKAIGDEYLNVLTDQAQLDAMPDPRKAKALALLKTIKQCFGFYIYYEFSPFGIGQATDNGMVETKTEFQAPTRKWVFDQRRQQSIDLASQLLEQILVELINNRADYPEFYAVGKASQYLQVFTQNGEQMLEACPPTGGSYRLWATLAPYFKKVDRDVLSAEISTAVMQAIKARLLAGSSTVYDVALLPYIREVEVCHAYLLAFDSLTVRQTEAGSIRVFSEFDGTINASSPTAEQLHTIKQQLSVLAVSSLKHLNNFLNKNIADYPDYANSLAYKAGGSTGISRSEAYKNIFVFGS